MTRSSQLTSSSQHHLAAPAQLPRHRLRNRRTRRPPAGIDTAGDARQTFEAHAGWILDTALLIGKSKGLPSEDAQDFASWVAVRLIRRDYAVVRACRSPDRLRNYLGIVIRNLAKDYRNHLWGKWRPSMAARRLGPHGIEFERLCLRDGFTLGEAIEHLRLNRPHGPAADELERMAGHLPMRPARTMVEFDAQELGRQVAVEPLAPARESRQLRKRVRTCLSAALAALDERDRQVLCLLYEDGRSVASVARDLELDQRALYARRDRCLSRLRRLLQDRGLRWAEVAAALAAEAGY